MLLLDKWLTRRSLFGVGTLTVGLLVFAFSNLFSGSYFNRSPFEQAEFTPIEQGHPPAIFPVRTKGKVSYFTTDQFAQTVAKIVSLELPLPSANLEGLTTTAAFSEGYTVHFHSVLDERVSISKADLTVLEILTAQDYCTDPTMQMFFDYAGQVIESVFSDTGRLVKQIVLHDEVCKQVFFERDRS